VQLVTVPNLLRLVLHWSGYGEEGDIGAYFAHAPSLYTESELEAALTAIDSHMNTETTPSAWDLLKTRITASQSFDDLALYQYAAAPGPSNALAHIVPPNGGAGTGAPGHPLQVSAVASIGTGSASRRKRGRMYLPGHCTALGADLQFTQAECNSLRDAATNYLASALAGLRASLAGGDVIRHVVFSPTGGLSTDSTSVIVDSRPDIQRRRANKQEIARTSPAGHVNP
jgi:hypothetical protein